MRKSHKWIFVFVVLILSVCIGLLIHLTAKSDSHEDEGTDHEGEKKSTEKIDFRPATNATYRKTCEGCHFPYPPGLLPASSWKSILNRLENHFGEQVPIDPQSGKEILNYLIQNGADRSSSNKSIRIMKSLKGKTPVRITEIPYIRDQHHEISKKTLSRKTIGFLSNCIACHKTADQGNFDEDLAKIPN